MIHKENLAVSPSEFKQSSIVRLISIRDYLNDVIDSMNEDDPDYMLLAKDINTVKLAVGQVEYSFVEIAKFLESLSDKVNTIAKEKAQ
jgi:septal ring factor EnvC (AmiA/AmiB activator)